MKLTYWTIPSIILNSDEFSLRAKRKKEVLEAFKALSEKEQNNYKRDVEKRTLEYSDGFHLLDVCLSESRGGDICSESVSMPIPPEYFAGYVPPPKVELPDGELMEGLL